MPNIHRHLITTSDELTWKFDRPVIFLGEWCRTYDRKHIWQNMDAIVAKPYGLGQLKKDADHLEARQLEDKLFPLLCEVLNKHHKTEHNERFWKIIIGHWFRRYIHLMLNRYKTLEKCLKSYNISGVTFHKNDQYALAPLDSNSAIFAANDSRWNDALNCNLLNLINYKNFPIEYIHVDDQIGFRFNSSRKSKTIKKTLQLCFVILEKATRLFTGSHDALIMHSYLLLKEEIKLNLSLGQFPRLNYPINFEVLEKPDKILRLALTEKLYQSAENNIWGILNKMLFQMIPVCYLEGFSRLSKISNDQPWPKAPKFIFTSNDFDTNEVFKFWVANKVKKGSKYFIGQHGNNYGTYRYMNPSIEEIISDKFLTWGWRDNLSQHTPAFIFKIASNRKSISYNPKGSLLLIEDMRYHRLDTWDRCAEYSIYSEDQIKFIRKLLKCPLNKLILRLHSSFKYNNPSEQEFWKENIQSIKIDIDSPIVKLISQSRLVVYSYDSTGILETMAQNIPTIAFWQNGLDHLRESAKPYYRSLIDAGVIHTTAESAASKINKIWNDIDGWWFSSEVQSARESFCAKYARVSPTPINDLKSLLC